ncbi:MAG: histidine phosphatase family protein [Pyrinomonadaceae bacterium]|nr:histidine phosphatase family protein [Pyrinomonadaceae bacterium]
MKTLYLLRHAKSGWDNADLSDYERPLNKRGREAAPLVGGVMREKGFIPELILSSPAERAIQTAILIKQTARLDGKIKFNDGIYEASPARLLEIIGALDEKIASVLLVGHNPGLEGLIRALTGELHSMPTAALAVIDLETDGWNDIISSTNRLRTLIRPKEIST